MKGADVVSDAEDVEQVPGKVDGGLWLSCGKVDGGHEAVAVWDGKLAVCEMGFKGVKAPTGEASDIA